MAQVKIYHDEDDREYTVNFDLRQGLLDDGSGESDFYIVINTTLRNALGVSYGEWRVRSLSDVPPGDSTATDFNDLCQKYIDYFMAESQLAESSSSEGYSSSSSQSESSSSSYVQNWSSSSESSSSSSSS